MVDLTILYYADKCGGENVENSFLNRNPYQNLCLLCLNSTF